MSKIVTAQELMDCKVDADTFGEAANGAPGVKVKARLGRVYWTLATYDKRFNDRAVLFDKMYVDYDNLLKSKVTEFDDSRNAQVKKYDDALAIKVKAFDDSLVKKNKEFDDSRNAQVTKYDNTLATKTKAFDDSLVKKNKEFDDARNAQVTKYNQTMDAKVVEYDLKINNVGADLKKATDTANSAKTTADDAKKIAGEAKVSADNATDAVGNKLDKNDLKDASTNVKGILKLSTAALANAGTDNLTSMTPKTTKDALLSQLNVTGVAPTFTCRAWATFNGVTTSVFSGGNISSVVRNATGDYTIYFSKPMPTLDFVVLGTVMPDSGGSDLTIYALKEPKNRARSVDSVRVICSFSANSGSVGLYNPPVVNIGVIC